MGSDSKCTDICSKKDSYKSQFVKVKQLNKNNNIATYKTVNRKRFTVFYLSKNGKEDTWKKKKEI